ncbi:MAG: hypothetical protein A3H49_03365 [Nitrospirae bacterium RIFCSPLOWO2_02_FULL_62_14]|nr:MAG: hypothetical protein A3H49_03365 [Nitrospirae bacterium RIFCSPLOWO2_02_FULL_62_14]
MKQISSEDYFQIVSDKARGLRKPESVTFELTYGCNLRCVHCYNPTHRALPHELTKQEVFSILDQIADLGVLHLHFTGGEPLVRPDAIEIYTHAKRLGLVLHLITNATRVTPAVAEALQGLDFDDIAVSIYGASKIVYERVTGIPGSYEQFRRGLDCLAARKLPVIVRLPVMVENAHEVLEARALVEGMGIKFQYCLDIVAKNNGDPAPLAHRLDPAGKVRVDQVFLEASHRQAPEPVCAANGPFIDCSCGRNRFAVTPYGEMNLCVAFPTPRYNLRKGTVREGWEVLKQTVDHTTPNERYECPTCEVRPQCRQGRNDAWLQTGDASACLPHYKEWATLEMRTYARPQPGQAD